jgi:hypothetical protein
MPQSPLSDAEVYARSLLSRCHGYPLWVPEPFGVISEYDTVGVRVGDVGYVTEEGAFETLFNVRAEANHPINQHGVPENFVPLRINERDITLVMDYHRAGTIPSKSGKQRSVGLDLSALDNP